MLTHILTYHVVAGCENALARDPGHAFPIKQLLN
jgi:hypothetical protein